MFGLNWKISSTCLTPLRLAPQRTGISLAGLAVLAAASAGPAAANPQGGTVVAGQATVTAPDANTVQVNQQSNAAIINWDSFSIGSGETTVFNMPSPSSVNLSRVVGNNLSEIYGNLQSNGQLYLINPQGVVFGKSASVNVGGLVATTANISDQNFLAGRMTFDRPSTVPGASIVNNGHISIADAGLGALVAPEVENNGLIEANLGKVVLGGAETFTLDMAGDGLISFAVGDAVKTAPADGGAAVTNSGTIRAHGGRVLLSAKVAAGVVDNAINMSGVDEARGVSVDSSGAITLDGGSSGVVQVSGTLDTTANFPDPGCEFACGERGRGGNIDIAGDFVSVRGGADIDARGGEGDGDVSITANQDIDVDIADPSGGAIAVHGSDITLEAGADASVSADGNSVLISASGSLDLAARGDVNLSTLDGFLELESNEALTASAGKDFTVTALGPNDESRLELVAGDRLSATAGTDLTASASDASALFRSDGAMQIAAKAGDVTLTATAVGNSASVELESGNSLAVSAANDVTFTASGSLIVSDPDGVIPELAELSVRGATGVAVDAGGSIDLAAIDNAELNVTSFDELRMAATSAIELDEGGSDPLGDDARGDVHLFSIAQMSLQSGGGVSSEATLSTHGGDVFLEADSPAVAGGGDGTGTLTLGRGAVIDTNVEEGDGNLTLIAADFDLGHAASVSIGDGDLLIAPSTQVALSIGGMGSKIDGTELVLLDGGEGSTATGQWSIGAALTAPGENGGQKLATAGSLSLGGDLSLPNIDALLLFANGGISGNGFDVTTTNLSIGAGGTVSLQGDVDRLEVSAAGADVIFQDSDDLTIDNVVLDLGLKQDGVLSATGNRLAFQAADDLTIGSDIDATGPMFLEADSPDVGSSDGKGTLSFEGGVSVATTGSMTWIGARFDIADAGKISAGSGGIFIAPSTMAPLTVGDGAPGLAASGLGAISTPGFVTIGSALSAGDDGLGTGSESLLASAIDFASSVSFDDVGAVLLDAAGSVLSGINSINTDKLAVRAGGDVQLNAGGVGDGGLMLAMSAPGKSISVRSSSDVTVDSVAGVTGISAADLELDSEGSVAFDVAHNVPGKHEIVSKSTITFNDPVSGTTKDSELLVQSAGDVDFNAAVGGLDLLWIDAGAEGDVVLAGGGGSLKNVVIGDLQSDVDKVVELLDDGNLKSASKLVKNGGNDVTFGGFLEAENLLLKPNGDSIGDGATLSVNRLLVSGDSAKLFGTIDGIAGTVAALFGISEPIGPATPKDFTFNRCIIGTNCTSYDPAGPKESHVPPEDGEHPPQAGEPVLEVPDLLVTKQRIVKDLEGRFSNNGNEEIW